MVVTVSPNPVVDTGQSFVAAVIQVETSPSFVGDVVDISSSQFVASCLGTGFLTTQGETVPITVPLTGDGSSSASVVLDDDGNVTIILLGTNCAPGSSVIEASLAAAPYYTALTTLVTDPPVVTLAGVTGYPNPEVETGDTSASGESDVYAIFDVETHPVYAKQPVEISANELESSCGQGWIWLQGVDATYSGSGTGIGTPIQSTLDDDGNSYFVFAGASCAAGTWGVVADVEAGTNPTYVTTFTVDPPAPTI
jgi:hypothetical protein